MSLAELNYLNTRIFDLTSEFFGKLSAGLNNRLAIFGINHIINCDFTRKHRRIVSRHFSMNDHAL